jgi:TonB family protein
VGVSPTLLNLLQGRPLCAQPAFAHYERIQPRSGETFLSPPCKRWVPFYFFKALPLCHDEPDVSPANDLLVRPDFECYSLQSVLPMTFSRPALVSLLLLCTMPRAFADDLGHNLQSEFRDQIRLIRGFYQDSSLHYDKDGVLIKGGHPGSWTTSYMYVEGIDMKPDAIEILGVRLAQVNTESGFRPMRTSARITIKIDEPTLDEEVVRKSLARVFIDSTESIADLLPEYWRGALNQSTSIKPSNAIAGKKKEECPPDATVENPCRVGGQVKPPRVITTRDPTYFDLARQAKYEGTSVLWLVIDQLGLPRRIHIARTVGFGLDEQAVEAVSHWIFQPATRDGNPVPVMINIKVNFRFL